MWYFTVRDIYTPLGVGILARSNMLSLSLYLKLRPIFLVHFCFDHSLVLMTLLSFEVAPKRYLILVSGFSCRIWLQTSCDRVFNFLYYVSKFITQPQSPSISLYFFPMFPFELVVKSKVPPRSDSSLEAVGPHP